MQIEESRIRMIGRDRDVGVGFEREVRCNDGERGTEGGVVQCSSRGWREGTSYKWSEEPGRGVTRCVASQGATSQSGGNADIGCWLLICRSPLARLLLDSLVQS
jgi:hypothetical protein